ncbi:hypothetical protein L2D04_00375 [Pantoea agglomerans]|jgi:hypothetical protein|uniref:hypothetical protein n=1 Tax=Enterobacter agglomerans TaxID=549 RepID=UPI001F2BD853|nr:hypothetical protein [Pantoea agglomerans]UJQ23610.1 hypothetical protein L2D04_00375 [Pantoea agglomerans]
MRDKFIDAIHNRSKIQLTFYSKEDDATITRLTAPMDFGPSRRAHDKSDRFHFWDYESDEKNHVLSLLPEAIESLMVIDQDFQPQEFVSWTPNWFIARDWGQHS